MSQPQSRATTYNDSNAETRTSLLRAAKIDESQIATPANSTFDALPKDVQDKLNKPASV